MEMMIVVPVTVEISDNFDEHMSKKDEEFLKVQIQDAVREQPYLLEDWGFDLRVPFHSETAKVKFRLNTKDE